MKALLLALAACFLMAAAPPPDRRPADAGGPLAPADIMRLRDMREAEISPDGRTILFTVQQQMSTFSPEHSVIWLVPSDGSQPARPFIAGGGADAGPRWSPDGRWVAFLSNQKAVGAAAPPTRQIWLTSSAGGDATPLTTLPGDVGDIVWSPDGKRIAFLAADPDTDAEKADKAAKRDWVQVDEQGHLSRLWIVDIASRTARPVSPDGVNVVAMDWSPDGRRLALKINSSPGVNDLFYHSRLVLIDAVSGAMGKPLFEPVAEGPKWSPDGRSILVEEILTPGFIGLAPRIIDVASARVTKLADPWPGLLTQARWAPDGRSVLALSFEKTRSRLVRIDPRAGAVSPIAAFDGEAANFTASDDGLRFAVALSSPGRPADVWTVEAGTPKVVTDINPQVATWRLGKVETVSWKNSVDGRTIYGVLVTPPGFAPGAPTKMVVQIHGGPEWAWWAGWLGSWHEWAQLLATHGYVVFLPNPRGSDGQGTDFARAVGADWGGMDYQDVLDGVDMLVARKIADPSRLGIGGWSYGGFMAAWAVTHGDRFKAAVVGAGPTDMTAMARITDTPDFPLGYFGAIEDHLAALDRASSVRLLSARETTPVLVLHGDQDTRVPVTLGLEFYRGLRMLGKDAEMIRFPGEPHWFHDPAHQEDVQRRVLGWFDAHLGEPARPTPAGGADSR